MGMIAQRMAGGAAAAPGIPRVLASLARAPFVGDERGRGGCAAGWAFRSLDSRLRGNDWRLRGNEGCSERG